MTITTIIFHSFIHSCSSLAWKEDGIGANSTSSALTETSIGEKAFCSSSRLDVVFKSNYCELQGRNGASV